MSVRSIPFPPIESLEAQKPAGGHKPAPPASLGLPDPAAAADPFKLVWTFADCIGDLEQLRGLVRALATEGSQRYGTLVVACRVAARLTGRLEQLRDADNQLARRDLEARE